MKCINNCFVFNKDELRLPIQAMVYMGMDYIKMVSAPSIVEKAKILRGKHMFFGEEREAFDGIIKIAEDALKIPLRNCDIGSFIEQQDRFDDLCGDSGGCANCPVGPTDWATTCEIKWANMPYNEKKEN